MDTFDFDLKARRSHFTKDEVIRGLRSFARAHPRRTLSCALYNAWPKKPCSHQAIIRRFGSWRAALLESGAPITRQRYSNADLMDALEHLWRQLGSPPGHHALKKRAGIDFRIYAKRWGSLKNARERLAQFHKGKITREQLLAPIPRPTPEKHLRASDRYAILSRDHFRCTLCGASPKDDHGVKLEVDHIRPRSRGGTNHPKNLRTLCRKCNRGKGAQLNHEYPTPSPAAREGRRERTGQGRRPQTR